MAMLDVTCPSGLRGKVDALRGKDAGVLADARALRTGKAADAILEATWKETLDPGPYGAGFSWRDVLAGDRTFALLMARVATFGQDFELELACPSCRARFVWELPLMELPTKPLPEASREKLARGDNRFEAEADGRKVWFKLLTGRDQARIAKMLQTRGGDLVVASLEARVLEVEGVAPGELRAWLSDLPLGEVERLVDAFDEADCGVETSVDVYCPTCDFEWEVELPLALTTLFAPKRSRKARGLPRAGDAR